MGKNLVHAAAPETRQASAAFLKKRSKKLLLSRDLGVGSVKASNAPDLALADRQPPANKSGLLLFFKKEALSSFRA
jgi:hypothetical protein